MNIVKKLNKHTIYYFCDNKIKYYINVPHKEFNTTNISIEFLEDTSKYDLEVNDVEWVKENIIEYYEKVDNDNITLLLPILKKEEKNSLLTLNVDKLVMIERLIALYINCCYIELTKNKINVNKEVFLIENDKFINFIKYFKEKHNSRIIVKRLIEINKNYDNQNFIKNNKTNDEVKPFSINEDILNEILNINKIEKVSIEENIPIMDETPIIQKNRTNDLKDNKIMDAEKSSQLTENKIGTKNINDKNIKTEITNEVKKEKIQSNVNIQEKDIKNNENNLNRSNDNLEIESNSNIIDKKEVISSKEAPTNNIINISDLGSLTAGGLNGALPGNVTINIERLVTENNEPIKSLKKEDEDDEVSELDEDISDIDEFDENEDFDLDAIDVSEAVLSSDDENKTYRTVTSGGVKFVVGRKDDEHLKPIEINKNNNIDLNEGQNLIIDMPTNIVKGDDQINKNAGFASYFTLFFVAISAIFIILYIIIK